MYNTPTEAKAMNLCTSGSRDYSVTMQHISGTYYTRHRKRFHAGTADMLLTHNVFQRNRGEILIKALNLTGFVNISSNSLQNLKIPIDSFP
mmetsp:Transcript_460/g.621  ORF Transcript_460/g.621 Transcript_460/m.621 type:complete len:91 (+) Transcript_460:865-1137(+)